MTEVDRPRRRKTDTQLVDMQSLPNWLKAAVYLGVPSVIALFLVYTLTTQIANKVAANGKVILFQQQKLDLIEANTNKIRTDTENVIQHFDEQVKDLMFVVRKICIAMADTSEKREQCIGN